MPPRRPSAEKPGQLLQRGFGGENFGAAKGQLAGEQLIYLEAEAIVGKGSIAVSRNDELLIVNQVRRISQHVAALSQGIRDQRQIELLEIANAAVDELCASA